MRIPPIPDHEEERISALQEHRILDTDPEQAYDDLVHLASHVTDTPSSMLTLVDRDRQWFKAREGFHTRETDREVSFCAHLVGQPSQMMVVEDTREDPRFRGNPFVESDPGIRFYAGYPLVTEEGHVIGSLCVVDYEPRSLSPEQREMLEALGRQAGLNLAMRRERASLRDRVESLKAQLDDFGVGRI